MLDPAREAIIATAIEQVYPIIVPINRSMWPP
jgi:hypothetical protein